MYRVHLFDELMALAGPDRFAGKRLLEIGPKDGLDSKRLMALNPAELVLLDLPEKDSLVHRWLPQLPGPHSYIVGNFMYLPPQEYDALGRFDLIWCTGVLYHNAEQLRMLRRLYKMLEPGGYLVLESATLRLAKKLRQGAFVEIHYPRTYRDTGTITHLPSAGAIKAWLAMVGFTQIHDSRCYEPQDQSLIGHRYACICQKTAADDGYIYYGRSGLNPAYRLGDAT